MKKPCRKSGKVKFDSHEQAAIRAGEILHEEPRPDDIGKPKYLRTYKCPDCDKWHLTSKEL